MLLSTSPFFCKAIPLQEKLTSSSGRRSRKTCRKYFLSEVKEHPRFRLRLGDESKKMQEDTGRNHVETTRNTQKPL